MRIGLVTDSLSDLPLDELLATAAGLGIECVEFGCGNWSQAPHLKLDALLASAAARSEFMAKLRGHGLSISALGPLQAWRFGHGPRLCVAPTLRRSPANSAEHRRCSGMPRDI